MAMIHLVCGGHLTAKTMVQSIFSHALYGDANYGNKEDCDWIIEAPPGKKEEARKTTMTLYTCQSFSPGTPR